MQAALRASFFCLKRSMSLSPKAFVADSEYLLMRAAAETAQVTSAAADAADAHQKLASAYLDRLFATAGDLSAAAPKEQGENLDAVVSVFANWALPVDEEGERLAAVLRSLP